MATIHNIDAYVASIAEPACKNHSDQTHSCPRQASLSIMRAQLRASLKS